MDFGGATFQLGTYLWRPPATHGHQPRPRPHVPAVTCQKGLCNPQQKGSGSPTARRRRKGRSRTSHHDAGLQRLLFPHPEGISRAAIPKGRDKTGPASRRLWGRPAHPEPVEAWERIRSIGQAKGEAASPKACKDAAEGRRAPRPPALPGRVPCSSPHRPSSHPTAFISPGLDTPSGGNSQK